MSKTFAMLSLYLYEIVMKEYEFINFLSRFHQEDKQEGRI